jgi:3-oxoacyl-(acyl-carrier-protein) synthase
MTFYINGIGAVTAQDTFDKQELFEDILIPEERMFSILKPAWKEYINPKLIRRMSKIIRMGVASGMVCIKEAGIEKPDAVITGTGLGCLQDTIKFLESIIANDEKLLNPAFFIQSTHNTISGQIALLLQCNEYNSTYAHRGFSFETALLDAMMLLQENEAKNVLVGGADEITSQSHEILRRLGYLKSEVRSVKNFMDDKSRGTIAGEGAAYFMISNEKIDQTYAQTSFPGFLYKPQSGKRIQSFIEDYFKKNELSIEDIDLVLTGNNGDVEMDVVYNTVLNQMFSQKTMRSYKHLFGDFQTVTSLGLMLAAKTIKQEEAPSFLKIRNEKPVRNILIYNHYKNQNHTIQIVSAC